jgi:excisionase family DNA binding protein
MMPHSHRTLDGVADLTRCPHCGRSLGYLTATEAAEQLGVHRNTIQRWVRDGTIREALAEQVSGGPRYLIPTREVNRLRRRRARSTA